MYARIKGKSISYSNLKNLNDDNTVNFLDFAEFAKFWLSICTSCMVDVPDVMGLTEAEAQESLGSVGLEKGTVTNDYNDIIPAGQVISSNPPVGTFVPYGSLVDLVISDGPCLVTVPDVTGQTQADANSMIVAAGLTVRIISNGL